MNKIVKIISSKIDDKTRRLIKSLGWGNDDVQETQTATAFGDDSHPVAKMVAIYAETTDIGNPVIIGYINKNQIADVGEKRIFSTDAEGNPVFAIHLKNDGTAEIGGNTDNLVRYEQTAASINEIKDDINNLKNLLSTWVPVPNDGGAALKAILSGYFPTPIIENISGAKIDEIKTL